MADSIFKILGSGAGPGAPSFFCDCKGCREAGEQQVFARTRSGACIATGGSLILIDTPPDLRLQLLRERIDAVDRIFLTHWHYDHFGGLGELEYYVKLKRREPIPLHLPPSALPLFRNAFPSLEEVFQVTPWSFGQEQHFGELSLPPLPANHSIETAGFLVQSPRKKLAYFPDTAGLPKQTAHQVAGVDWLICDATFHGENWFPHSHMSIAEAIRLGGEVGARSTVLTHMSVHYSEPLNAEELQGLIAPHRQVLAGYDGMTICL